MATITFEILSNDFNRMLQRYIQEMDRSVDSIVFEQASNLLAEVVETWPVDTGVSRASWGGPFRIAAAAYQISNPQPYARRIEFGTYPGVGPKTVELGDVPIGDGIVIEGGIFPSQVPAAPVRRALLKRTDILGAAIVWEMRAKWGRA